MAGSRFGRHYDKTKLVAPSLIDAEVLRVLALTVGTGSAPALAHRQLLARRMQGEDVVCVADERDLFIVLRNDLPDRLAPDEDD